MDFTTLDTKQDAEKGALLHFKHPQNGHLLYTGEGADSFGRLADKNKPHEAVTAIVRGMESQAAQDVSVAAQKRIMAGEDGEGHEYDLAIALVAEINGVERDGKPIKADRDGLMWFYGRSEGFAVQVMQFAGKSANFFAGSLQK